MEFTYEKLNWNKTIKTVSPENIINAPVGLTNNYQWVDLYGEGIFGILTEQGEGWYYKSNLGDVAEDGEVVFTVAQKVIPKPSFTGLANGVLSLQDLAANGEKQVVVNNPGVGNKTLELPEVTEDRMPIFLGTATDPQTGQFLKDSLLSSFFETFIPLISILSRASSLDLILLYNSFI